MRLGRIAQAAAPYVLVAAILAILLWRYEPITVAGGSMSPALHHGDLAIVRRRASVTPGDIALLRQAGHTAVLHRVTRREKDGSLVTRGDANPIDDFETAAPAEVAGVVVSVLPFGDAILRWRGTGESDTLSAQSDTRRR